jgi:type III pantothenate kinase
MLLMDAGNSRCKWVWTENGSWQHRGVLENADDKAWLALKGIFSTMPAPGKIMVSNVAGEAIARRLREVSAIWDCVPEFIVSQAEQCGVRNGYANAPQLGSDRWAALIAAWHRLQQACLVVNCGTATTVDALSSTGAFVGGLILPGVELMQRSLAGSTAQLDVEMGEFCQFPRNTADAIRSGALQATAGAIRQQHQLLTGNNGKPCAVLLSGGAAEQVAGLLGDMAVIAEDLVLLGLQLIGRGCQDVG